MMKLVRLAIPAVLGCTLAVAARAAPPPDANPAFAHWFNSLQRPDGGGSCCSINSDCRVTEFRTAGDHYQAIYAGAWIDVPPRAVLHRRDNPLGRAVLCAMSVGAHVHVFCFVPGAES